MYFIAFYVVTHFYLCLGLRTLLYSRFNGIRRVIAHRFDFKKKNNNHMLSILNVLNETHPCLHCSPRMSTNSMFATTNSLNFHSQKLLGRALLSYDIDTYSNLSKYTVTSCYRILSTNGVEHLCHQSNMEN